MANEWQTYVSIKEEWCRCPQKTSIYLFNKMASIACESVQNNDVKTQFVTREGYYKLMTSAEYSRPNRLGYATQPNNTAVKVSFVAVSDTNGTTDRICFNVGRELYVYTYKGVKKVFFLAIITVLI